MDPRQEKEKRDREAEDYKNFVFAQLMESRLQYNRERWKKVSGKGPGKPDKDYGPCGAIVAKKPKMGCEPDIYQYMYNDNVPEKDRFNIDFRDGRTARPIPPPTDHASYKKSMETAVDFLFGKAGADTIELTFDAKVMERMSESQKKFFLEEMKKNIRSSLRLLSKKGLAASFDEGMMEVINQMSVEDQNRFHAMQQKLQVNKMKAELFTGLNNDKVLKEQTAALSKNAKIETVFPAGTDLSTDEKVGEKLAEKAFEVPAGAAALDLDQKLQKTDEKLEAMKQRQADANAYIANLENIASAQYRLLQHPEEVRQANKVQFLLSSKRDNTLSSIKNMFTTAISKREEKFKEETSVIDEIEKHSKLTTDSRKNMVEEAKKEVEDLKKMARGWDKEIQKLETAAVAPTDEQTKKITELKTKLTDLNADIAKTEAKIRNVEGWENKQKPELFANAKEAAKEKMDEKAKRKAAMK